MMMNIKRTRAMILGVLLLVTPIALLFYSHIAGRTQQIRDFPDVFKSESSEYTSSACAKEFHDFPRRYNVLQAIREDGFQPIQLSDSIISTKLTTPATSTENGQISSRIRNTFLLPDSTRQEDSSKRRKFQFLGMSENCTTNTSGLIEMKQILVPNVVHYVFIGSDFQFKFMTYLSVLSADRFLRPDQIFIHGDVIPNGKWWNTTVEQVKNIYHVQRTHPKAAPNGQPFKFMAHVSDYMRAEILLRYGGIYLDPDVLVLKSFQPLRQFPFVLGRESGDSVGNGIIIAQKDAPFLRLMLEQYWSYQGPNEEWATQSVHNVHTLARVFPHLIHVEETSLNRPNWMERSQIYDGNYNWMTNYAMHLWLRLWPKEKVPSELNDVIHVNTTFGEMARHILFGA